MLRAFPRYPYQLAIRRAQWLAAMRFDFPRSPAGRRGSGILILCMATQMEDIHPYPVARIGLIGGGHIPRPGEVSLAQNGVLFLDELPEYKKHVLEVLRQPLEERRVTIARAAMSLTYPAAVMLVVRHLGHLQLPGCGPESGCAELAAGRFGNVFGWPVSHLGTAWFAAMLVTWLIAGWRPSAGCLARPASAGAGYPPPHSRLR